MVKSVLSYSHQGLRDWIYQRISAIYMAIYTVGLAGFIIYHPNLSYEIWHGLFAMVWMKIASIIFILLLLIHAWVGMWTVFTDYIPNFVVRAFINTLVLFALTAFFFQALLIFWGI